MTASVQPRLIYENQSWTICHFDGGDSVIPSSAELGFDGDTKGTHDHARAVILSAIATAW